MKDDNNKKIYLLFCNNTSKPPVIFMYSHYVTLIIFFSKTAKNKAIRKQKQGAYPATNLRSRKPCGQSSIKTLYKGLP